MSNFYKRENSAIVLILTLAFAISFVVNSIVFVVRVTKNVNATPKTAEQMKREGYDACLQTAYGKDKVACKDFLK